MYQGKVEDLCGTPKLTLSRSDKIPSIENISGLDKKKMPGVWSLHTTHKMPIFRPMITAHQSSYDMR